MPAPGSTAATSVCSTKPAAPSPPAAAASPSSAPAAALSVLAPIVVRSRLGTPTPSPRSSVLVPDTCWPNPFAALIHLVAPSPTHHHHHTMRHGRHRHTASGASAVSATSATSHTSRASGSPPPVPEPAPSTSSSGSTSAAITAAALRKKLLVTALADDDAALGSSSTDVTGSDAAHAARSARSHGWRAKWRRILSLLRVVKKWPRKRQDEWHKSLHAAAVHSLQHSAAHSEDGGVVDGNGPRRIEDGAAGANSGGQEVEGGAASAAAAAGASERPPTPAYPLPAPLPPAADAVPVPPVDTDFAHALDLSEPIVSDDDDDHDHELYSNEHDASESEDEDQEPPAIRITLDDGFNYDAFTIERAHIMFPRRPGQAENVSTIDRRRRVRRKASVQRERAGGDAAAAPPAVPKMTMARTPSPLREATLSNPGATLGAAFSPLNVVIDTPLPPPASPPAAPVVIDAPLPPPASPPAGPVTDAARAPDVAEDDAPLPPPVVVLAKSAMAPVLTTSDLAASTPQADAPTTELAATELAAAEDELAAAEDEPLDPPMIHITLDDGFNYEAFTIERAHTVFPRRAQDKVDQSTLDRRRRVRRKSDAPTPEAAAAGARDKSPLQRMWSVDADDEVVGHREAGIGAGAAE